MDLELSIGEAYRGAKKTINMQLEEVCESCNGSGAEKGGLQVCRVCNGKGQVVSKKQTGYVFMTFASTCSHCRGVGKVIEKPCKLCKGRGRVSIARDLTVDVPPGVRDGDLLRLRAPFKFAPEADLLLRIRIRKSENLELEGEHIHLHVPLLPSEALLGRKFKLKYFDGEIDLRAPPGVRSGFTQVIKGRGLMGDIGRGDLIIHFHIVTPDTNSAELKKLYQEIYKMESAIGERLRGEAFRDLE
ncbi:MAG: hypothetical protein NZ920_04290 [Aigarchaeota archaeon]|nr:hypothetical protein [Aigarchaeota archaeon]